MTENGLTERAVGFYLAVSSDFHCFALTIGYRFAKTSKEEETICMWMVESSVFLYVVAFTVRPAITGQTGCYACRDDIAVRRGGEKESDVKRPLIYKIDSASSFRAALIH
ncbi:hypothetical protein [Symbiopectobacterium sp.]|uniref:hypothetical protein n=1 Tax=Symbiopectobacterium sp. TaxID=2952789 RepID=UPI003F6894DA